MADSRDLEVLLRLKADGGLHQQSPFLGISKKEEGPPDGIGRSRVFKAAAKARRQVAVNDWQLRREALLQEACEFVAKQLPEGIPIGRSIHTAAHKFRNRSLGDGRKLRLASTSMRRAWDVWRKGGRVSSTFRLHYRAGKPRHAIDRALLRLVALDCVNGGRTLAEVIRTTRIASRAGASVSARTIYRRLPARTLQQLGTLQRRISRECAAIQRRKCSVLQAIGK